MAAVRRRLRLPDTTNWEFNHRYAFGWRAFTSLKRGISIVDFGASAADRLRESLSSFQPKIAHLDSAIAYRTDHLVNAVPRAGLQKAKSLLQLVEASPSDALVIPMESHFVPLGRTTVVGCRHFEVQENEPVTIARRQSITFDRLTADASSENVRFRAASQSPVMAHPAGSILSPLKVSVHFLRVRRWSAPAA